MRISGVIYPPSEKFPAFISIIPNNNHDELVIFDIFTRKTYLTGIWPNPGSVIYEEFTNGVELEYLEKRKNYYYIPYIKALIFSQSYYKIINVFDFTHDNQTLYYIPKTISAMFNYTSSRPSIENYVILCYTIDVYDIRSVIFHIWSHIILLDKNGYEIIDKIDTSNRLWTLGALLSK